MKAMTIFSLIRSVASNLWRSVISLAWALVDVEDREGDASRRDWEEAEYVFQRRDF
jgi:hypothetical protein